MKEFLPKDATDEVVDFIEKRFSKDSDWLNGNCYYFALILKTRFPKGKIYYDTIEGHFVLRYEGKYYDWLGEYTPVKRSAVKQWSRMGSVDPYLRDIIKRDCLM